MKPDCNNLSDAAVGFRQCFQVWRDAHDLPHRKARNLEPVTVWSSLSCWLLVSTDPLMWLVLLYSFVVNVCIACRVSIWNQKLRTCRVLLCKILNAIYRKYQSLTLKCIYFIETKNALPMEVLKLEIAICMPGGGCHSQQPLILHFENCCPSYASWSFPQDYDHFSMKLHPIGSPSSSPSQ